MAFGWEGRLSSPPRHQRSNEWEGKVLVGKQPQDFPVEHSQGGGLSWINHQPLRDRPWLSPQPCPVGSVWDPYGNPNLGGARRGWGPPLAASPLPSLCLLLAPGLKMGLHLLQPQDVSWMGLCEAMAMGCPPPGDTHRHLIPPSGRWGRVGDTEGHLHAAEPRSCSSFHPMHTLQPSVLPGPKVGLLGPVPN